MVSEHASPLAVVGGVDAGGQNVHVAALAAHLTKRGHDVTVFTRRDGPEKARRVRSTDGYTVEYVPAGPPEHIGKDDLLPLMGEFADHLAERWAGGRFDIAHAHFWMSGLAASQAARAAGIPVVQTFHALGTVKRRHQQDRDTSPADRIDLEKQLCRDVDHVIATCADEIAELGAMGLPDGRASVIPCGVDMELFQPSPPPPARGRRARLLAVGRLVERKGLSDVIDALARLPQAELLVAGGPPATSLDEDPEVQRLRRRAEMTGTIDRVRFLGQVAHADLPALIGSIDVVVAVPWYEPFGIVPLEAMASARPVVGSAVGGLLDTVVPGVTGELVPPRAPKELAKALRHLLRDRRRCASYGAAGARRAWRHYRWSAIARDTESVYTTVAAQVEPVTTGVMLP